MTIKRPRSAGGWGAIAYSLRLSMKSGFWSMFQAMRSKNACKTCALGMGGQQGGMQDESARFPAVCNKSFQAQSADLQPGLGLDFFARHDLNTLAQWSPKDLEHAGRLTHPMICTEADSHYQYISWPDAMEWIVERLKATSPNRSFFYFSGRSSNEASFLLQLFARIYGTNNVNNCSYYCHQASGVGLSQTLGTGTATIELDDLKHSDLIFLMGANPASNHPRFMTVLMELRRRGGKVIVVNPARERGLENFSVPSDLRSLLFGSRIASTYLQPHIGGDIAFCKGVAKALFDLAQADPKLLDQSFIEQHTEQFEDYKADVMDSSWDDLERESGLTREQMHSAAEKYAQAKNVVFAWAMGMTHHTHGVQNVQSIVNLALLRGMVGRPHCGLLPLRGHSNVQGVGSMGVTPELKQAVMDNLHSLYEIDLPKNKGMDTLACMDAAHAGKIDFAWNLGGNLYGSNPDAKFAQEALDSIDSVLYMNTTLNQGHFRGRGKTTLILPVLARDEEPERTTQESMFSFVRLSEGGQPRHHGPRSEISIIGEVAESTFPDGPIPWEELGHAQNLRKVIGSVVPGFEKMKTLDHTREEFHISGRIFHTPQFPTDSGKAQFTVCDADVSGNGQRASDEFCLMTVRSEGQFNTVVYETFDKYRGIDSRDVVLMNPEDIERQGWRDGDRVTVSNETGQVSSQRLVGYPVKAGNIMMYYPEANWLVSRQVDEQSRTPSFKSVWVRVQKEESPA